MTTRFILEKKESGELVHISTSTSEKNPYTDLPEYFEWKYRNRCDKEWEAVRGGDGRFYLHSASNNSGEIRILILYNQNKVGNKEILSEVLEDRCLELMNKDYSNLHWWFELEKDSYDKEYH